MTGSHSRPRALDLTTLVRRQHPLRGALRLPESNWSRALARLDALAGVRAPLVGQPRASVHRQQAGKVRLRPAQEIAHA